MLRHARRLRHVWSISLILVFALCLAVQPVLAALGEMHAFSAHAATADLHLEHRAPHEEVQAGSAAQEDTGGTLHLLLHYAHCCGHTVALAVDEFAAPSLMLDSTPVLPSVSQQVVASHLGNPFRPPIRA